MELLSLSYEVSRIVMISILQISQILDMKTYSSLTLTFLNNNNVNANNTNNYLYWQIQGPTNTIVKWKTHVACTLHTKHYNKYIITLF